MMQSTGQLAVIATPIGNLGDLSPRAAKMLQNADILACEDTRITRKLLTLTGLRTSAKFMPYHDHNGKVMRCVVYNNEFAHQVDAHHADAEACGRCCIRSCRRIQNI